MRLLSNEGWAAAWAFAGGFLLVSAYSLGDAAMTAIATDPSFTLSWCGPTPHAAIGVSTVFGHCAQCWLAMACAALGAAALFQTGRLSNPGVSVEAGVERRALREGPRSAL